MVRNSARRCVANWQLHLVQDKAWQTTARYEQQTKRLTSRVAHQVEFATKELADAQNQARQAAVLRVENALLSGMYKSKGMIFFRNTLIDWLKTTLQHVLENWRSEAGAAVAEIVHEQRMSAALNVSCSPESKNLLLYDINSLAGPAQTHWTRFCSSVQFSCQKLGT